jgi:hypothetical protein
MVLGMIGCGVKGPPMPSQNEPIPAVTDLKATMGQEEIVLTWSGAGDSKEITEYDVYTSRSDLSQPPCQGCPQVFEKVGSLPITGQRASERQFRFSFSAAPGFRYLIKVRARSETGNRGPESNTVMIEFQK